MKKVHIKLLISSLILFGVIVFATGTIAQESRKPRNDLNYLEGTWIGEYDNPQMQHISERNTYRWDESKSYLTVSVQLTMNGKPFDSGYGFMTIDKPQNTLRSHMIAGIGMVHEMYEIKREADGVLFEGKTVGLPFMPEFRFKMKIVSENKFTYTYLMKQDDKWIHQMMATYERINNQ